MAQTGRNGPVPNADSLTCTAIMKYLGDQSMDITSSTRFTDLMLDSLDIVNILEMASEIVGQELTFRVSESALEEEDLGNGFTVGDFSSMLVYA